MNEEPTPETDAFYNGPCHNAGNRRQREFARRLERERNHFAARLNEVREILCDALPNRNEPTSMLASILAFQRDEVIMAARDLKRSKGRHNTQIAADNLFKLIP